MRKIKRFGIMVCGLILGGLWWYWARPLPLHELLPEETWTRMELEQILPNNLAGDLKFADPPLDEVLAVLPAIRVNRTEARSYLDDECFRITLYKEEAWPTVLYVGSTGRVDIAVDMQFDDWKYYEGGEALYLYIYNLSKNLSGMIPVE